MIAARSPWPSGRSSSTAAKRPSRTPMTNSGASPSPPTSARRPSRYSASSIRSAVSSAAPGAAGRAGRAARWMYGGGGGGGAPLPVGVPDQYYDRRKALDLQDVQEGGPGRARRGISRRWPDHSSDRERVPDAPQGHRG